MRSVTNVHDLVAELTEVRWALERLGEEIGRVLRSGHVGDLELERLDHVAHEEVSSLDVLHAVVVLRVVRDVARALAVSGELGRIGRARAKTLDGQTCLCLHT